jgi:two-component system, LytTR family, sensor kinase
MRLIVSWKYHILSFIGWLLYIFMSLFMMKLINRFVDVKTWDEQTYKLFYYAMFESFTTAILAYLLSNIILWYIDYKINFNSITKKTLFGLLITFVITQTLYTNILWPLLNKISLMYSKNPILENDTGFYIKLVNSVFFSSFFLVWMFVVLAYKTIVHLREVKIKKIELESNLRESTLNSLKGQINPHFMFNSLNNIRGLVLEDPFRSRDMITRLSEMLRYSLTKNDLHQIKLEDELEMVENYIQISKIQMEDRLQYIDEVAPETLVLKIPPMILQMLVENAVKHGVSNLKEGGFVKVLTKVQNEVLLLQVINTGKLTIQSDSTQIGLKNIASRLKLLYGEKAIFDLKEEKNEVKAEISIPLA